MGMIKDKGIKDTWNKLKVKLIDNLKKVLEYYGFDKYEITFQCSENANSLYIGYKYNLYDRVELKF